MTLCLAYVTFWWHSLEIICSLLGCITSPFFFGFFGVFSITLFYVDFPVLFGAFVSLEGICDLCTIHPASPGKLDCCVLGVIRYLGRCSLPGDINVPKKLLVLSLLFRTGYVNHPPQRTSSQGTTCPAQGAHKTWHYLFQPYMYGFLLISEPSA